MPRLEFVVKGPPVGVNAKEHSTSSRKKYRTWKSKVAEEARAKLPEIWQPLTSEVIVQICNFHAYVFHDVDNVIKPIFDGMNGVVFIDDKQVRRVTSFHVDLGVGEPIEAPADLVVEAIDRNGWDEFIHVVVEW